jgi:hypothetical protein
MLCRHDLLTLSLLLALLLASPALAQNEAVKEPPITPKDEAHWAFQKPERPNIRQVREPSWIKTPIDAFILARLEKEGLRPASPADRTALLRRITFDLTGLPPTPEELGAFLNDAKPDAYARVVERLLASPHYGERWAQHWLDVVRYAESNGYEADGERPHAWRYRDYVIGSYNADKPYDRFVIEQVAGDLLARGQDGRQCAELLIAAGFHRCGPVHLTSGNLDAEVGRQEVLTEMTNGVGAAFLGLTIGCARCHDHKFDPVSQADYYRLQAFFAPTQAKDVAIATPEERAATEQRIKELKTRIQPLEKQVSEIDAPHRDRLQEEKKRKLEPAYRDALAIPVSKRTVEQRKLAADAETLIKVTWDEIIAVLAPAERRRRSELRSQIHALESQLPPPSAQAWTVADTKPAPTHILKRGDPKRKGQIVEPSAPRVLNPASGQLPKPEDRLALAHWLTSPENPLTARVIVNRLWQHHFGRGLVGTPNDFGRRGEKPTHPELLDWLASELVTHGWSLKHMHRLMVLSNTYQQSSQLSANEPARQKDPENRLLGRMNRRRLEGETLRDCVLAATGRLNPKLGGPMVRVPLEPEVYELIFTEGEPDGLWHATPNVREHCRRSIYLFAKRNVRLPMLEAFDQPDTVTSCPARAVSTFAPQALILLNGPFMQEQSKAFAARLLRLYGTDIERQVESAYRFTLSRLPKEDERRSAREFLDAQAEQLREQLRARRSIGLPGEAPDGTDPARAAALVDFCLAILNRNEFLYVP